MYNQVSFLARSSIGIHFTEQVTSQKGSDYRRCPLQACCQTPKAIMPIYDVETSCQRFEKNLHGGCDIAECYRSRLRMNNLYFKTCCDERVDLGFDKCARVRNLL